MIDRDDRDEDRHEEGDQGGDAATVEPTGQDGAETPEPEARDTGAPSGEDLEWQDDKPAMAMESGSDEGGTVEDAPREVDEQPAVTEADPEPAMLVDAEEEHEFEGDDLGLVSDDDALPWLESSDYDDVDSVDAWRVTGFVVLGLVVLAMLVGGIWYFSERNGDGQPIADGSTIEAPDGPYKERPEDPGGKTFDGTGDMAPAVGEGESREGRLAEGSATPEPIAEPAPAETPEETPSTATADDGRIAVQVGAYRDQATAEAGWRQLGGQTDALAGVRYRVVRGEADIGTVYRLQALPGDMAAARRLRDALQADGIASQIKQ